MRLLLSFLVQYSNNHLIEVSCGFEFPEETTTWDSTYFGRYFEKIKSLGFNQRTERKGVQIKFEANLIDASKEPFTTSQAEDQVIFRDEEKGLAVLIGKGRISFHCVKNYMGWEGFLNEVIKPYSELYKTLDLGNGKRQCSIVYLNRFNKEVGDGLSDYFTLISPLEQKFGAEIITSVQRIISNKNNLLISKLNSQVIQNIQNINLECGAVCIDEECIKNNDWIYQANQTHEPIFNFFKAITTDNLRNTL
ncbi:MAG: TIGR04255 family protein [Bacteroidota bacterium]|nr:TIGR04255 family protein [Bacteroidota bacterium]